eukprot:TRINITY_DN4753_c0_g2_i1.p1 TRINITY_DN4753_c0_g2~~TRINITY_DN4753_c0_g2_i1.p1  ORF type:complete len:392 (+),score=81.34 TRINITY_DN4753_c0_g2_i1:58-1233(+)
MGDVGDIMGVKKKRKTAIFEAPKPKMAKEVDEVEKKIQGIVALAGRSNDATFEAQIRREVTRGQDIKKWDYRPTIPWGVRGVRHPMRTKDDMKTVACWAPKSEPPVDPKMYQKAAILLQPPKCVTLTPEEYQALSKEVKAEHGWNESATMELFNIVKTLGVRWYVVHDRLCERTGLSVSTAAVRKRYYTISLEIIKMRKKELKSTWVHEIEATRYDGEKDQIMLDVAEQEWDDVVDFTPSREADIKSRIESIKTALHPFKDHSLESVYPQEGGLLASVSFSSTTLSKQPEKKQKAKKICTAYHQITNLPKNSRTRDTVGTIELYTSTEKVRNSIIELREEVRMYYHMVEAIKKEEIAVNKLQKETEKLVKKLPETAQVPGGKNWFSVWQQN